MLKTEEKEKEKASRAQSRGAVLARIKVLVSLHCQAMLAEGGSSKKKDSPRMAEKRQETRATDADAPVGLSRSR